MKEFVDDENIVKKLFLRFIEDKGKQIGWGLGIIVFVFIILLRLRLRLK